EDPEEHHAAGDDARLGRERRDAAQQRREDELRRDSEPPRAHGRSGRARARRRRPARPGSQIASLSSGRTIVRRRNRPVARPASHPTAPIDFPRNAVARIGIAEPGCLDAHTYAGAYARTTTPAARQPMPSPSELAPTARASRCG